VGTHANIIAHYAGDGNYAASVSSAIEEDVSAVASTTSIGRTTGTSPTTYGATVTWTAHVTQGAGGTPTGTVDFYEGVTLLGSDTLDGSANATFTSTALSVGTHSDIHAVYLGDTDNAGSTSSSMAQVISKASTSTAIESDGPSTYGGSVLFTATVTSGVGAPTGTVEFFDGATSLGSSALDTGVATLSVSALSGGNHTTVHAVYSGDGELSTSTSSNMS
jgi:hypothetical protein